MKLLRTQIIVIKKLLSFALSMSAIFLVLYFAFRIFVFDSFVVPSSSMMPTIKPGDRVVVNKLIMGARIYKDYNFTLQGVELNSFRTRGIRLLKHNDIVVFNFPVHNGKISFIINEPFCKRIVALPGDTISINNGFYKNNNYNGILGDSLQQQCLSQVSESSLPVNNDFSFENQFNCHATIKNMPPLYVPRKGDVITLNTQNLSQYRIILEWELGKKITLDAQNNNLLAGNSIISTHIFQHNYYFMAGDNMIDSYDSRYWGFVPEEYIIGVVTKILH